MDLEGRVGESTLKAVVTSYRCRDAWIDSTGQSPTLSAIDEPGAPIVFDLPTEQPPRSIEVRRYPGAGVAASFQRWPEELPSGVEPLERFVPDPGPSFKVLLPAEPGEYSLVMRIEWPQEVEVFYALGLAIEAAAAPLPAEETPPWATYANPVFRISLRHPAPWQPAPGEEERKYAAPTSEAGGGYFILDAIGAPQATIDEVAAGQAEHKLRPYGSQPRIEPLEVDGQEARLILPSADASMGDQAMLIARYPQPVDLAGTAYTFFALYADEGHIRALARSLHFEDATPPGGTSTPAPPPSEGAARPRIDSFQVAPAQAEPGETLTLTWAASGRQATLCPSTRYVLFTGDACQDVAPSGAMTFTLPADLGGNRFVDFILTLEGEEDSEPEVWQASVAIKCSTTWFYTEAPQAGICPQAAIRSPAAAERFEQGIVIWLEQPGQYFILVDAPLVEGDVRKRVDVVRDPLQAVRDTSASTRPPEGLYAPESGIGLVWRGDVRGSAGYTETLGWALGPEVGYEALYQCDDALPSGGRSWQTCTLQGAEDEVYVFHPLGGWHLLGERR
jgi:hypothetical protein